jgi:hypothetical protein
MRPPECLPAYGQTGPKIQQTKDQAKKNGDWNLPVTNNTKIRRIDRRVHQPGTSDIQ